ncbi:histone-lysine N-methyltransferase, H3 lysine-79 specific-like [Mercenaria mercenaria]|uniref:histone-lysine N-methyltransferase, H3 lysine-79 specific-like n=1 Tax=Mercenaria mercenaria TaxID=6596 RepID=UPI00234EFA15|nr:histone-lysine N-methyltransferase, H3 lysine-79 specific-like [Mercenaria mercenaria]
MDYNKWVAMGERMGFSGTELSDYVDRKEKDYTEREERMLRRHEERRRYDDEQRRFVAQEAEKKRLFELEQAEKKRLFELERLEKERALKEQELEMLKIKADAGALGTDKGAEHLSSKTLRPRLPKFEEREVEAMVLTTLICDLVIGNIKGASDRPDINWSSRDGEQSPSKETLLQLW